MVDEIKMKEAVRLMLEAIDEDPGREGLLDTPDRIARMYTEIFAGMDQDPADYLKKTFTCDSNDIVLEKDIPFYSMCEHHFLPFFGKAHVAYIPTGKVTGLSKLARCVEVYAKRPQIQEQLTAQIADAIVENLNPSGVMVMIEAEHMCMTMRGIRKPGAITVTQAKRGVFETDSELVSQFYHMLGK